MTATTLPRTDRLTLHEHTERPDVTLSADQARALAQFRFTGPRPTDRKQNTSSVVKVTPGGRPGTYTLLPGSIVGSFSVAGVDINVLPKVGVGKTVQLLAYNAGVARVLADAASFTDSQSLPDLLAPAFLDLVDLLVAEGLVEDYIITEETGPRPRGTIDFSSLARRGIPTPVDYCYDDFVSDTQFNRLLYRGLYAVRDLSGVSDTHRAEARRLLSAFPEVSFESAPFLYRGEPLPDRNAHYRNAMTLATMILDGVGIEPVSSQVTARGLLFDMNRVFEEFVTNVIRKTAPAGATVDAQGSNRPRYLDTERHYRLKPDFALWDGQKCRMVGDVKYKIIDNSHRTRQADLYQMLSYATALETRQALLFYAGNAEDCIVTLPNQLMVRVCALDLESDLHDVEAAIASAMARY